MVSNKDKKKSRMIEIPDIEVVQTAIEKCIRYGMRRNEIIKFLGFKIDPALICIVWDVMKSENVEFFKSYYATQYACDQLAEHKRLLQLKNKFDMSSNSSAASNYIHNNLYQNSWHNSSYSAEGTTGLTQNRNFNNNPLLHYNGVNNMPIENQSQPMDMINYNCSTQEAMKSYDGHVPEYNIPNTSQYYTQTYAMMNCNGKGHSNGMLTEGELVKVKGLSPFPYGSQPIFHQSLVTGIALKVEESNPTQSRNPITEFCLAVAEPNFTPNEEVDFLLSDTYLGELNPSSNMEADHQLSDTYGFDEESFSSYT